MDRLILGHMSADCPSPFIAHWWTIAECQMASLGVGEPFERIEERHAGRPMRRKRASVEQFAFLCHEETFHQRVVVAVAPAPPRGEDVGVMEPLPEGAARVLAAVIGVMDRPGLRSPACNRQSASCSTHLRRCRNRSRRRSRERARRWLGCCHRRQGDQRCRSSVYHPRCHRQCRAPDGETGDAARKTATAALTRRRARQLWGAAICVVLSGIALFMTPLGAPRSDHSSSPRERVVL